MSLISTCCKDRLKRFALAGSTLLMMTLSGTEAKAQLSGVYTIPTDYPTLASAITALNTQGVNGPVTINIPAGFTETAPVGGYVLNATGTSTSTITFQKSGSGANPLLSAYVGTATPSQAVQDGVWSLNGSDYITIDGIDIVDGNTTNPATMEYGFALYKASAADGCQNNTIKNCVVTLNRINNANGAAPMVDGSVGILTINSTISSATVALTPTVAASSNSNNKFYNNTVQNCHHGIVLIGYAAVTPFTASDTGNDVGGASTATGNHVFNFGGAPSSTVAAAGIRTLAQQNLNISYNVINSNNGSGANHPSTLRGIYINTATSAFVTANSNTITVSSAATTNQLAGIENASGSTAANNTITMNSNVITNCSYSTATSGNFFGIYNTSSPAALNINGNTFTNNSSAGTSGSFFNINNTGSVATLINMSGNMIDLGTLTPTVNTSIGQAGISNTGAASTATINISGNTFQNAVFTGTANITAAGYCINNTPTSAVVNINGNSFVNLSIKSSGDYILISNSVNTPSGNANGNMIVTAFNKTIAGGTVTGYANLGNPTSGVVLCAGNNFSNVTLIGATAFNGINHNTSTTQQIALTGNTISNVSTGNGAVAGIIYVRGNIDNEVNFNTVTNLSGANSVYGIAIGNTASNALKVYGNTINNLSTSGASAVYGIYHLAGNSTSIYKNKITNLSGSNAGSSVIGYYQTGGGTTNIYNNIIGDLNTPAANGANAITGIYLSSGTTVNVHYNTVYMNAVSTGTLFGTSALYSATGLTTLNVRDNIFVNKSGYVGTGLTVAHRRSGTGLGSFGTASNNNLYYAGTPGANRLIYYDGTNSDQTLAAYKTRVGTTRELVSVTEDPAFASTTSSNSNYLSFAAAASTAAESGGINISGMTDDFNAVTRFGNAGYTGTGTAPDMGAFEFEGTNPALIIGTPSTTPTATTLCVAAPRTINLLVTPGASSITAVTLTYSVNGVAQPTVAMSGNASAASVWTANIPQPSPVTSTVTWSISATDGNYTKYTSIYQYADEPLTGYSGVASISSSSVCSGSPLVLTGRIVKPNSLIAVGSGTSTSSSSVGSPFYHAWGGQKVQYIYTAAELTAAGLGAGNITSIAYDITAVGTTTLTGFAVSMGVTTQTAFATATTIPGTSGVYSAATQSLVVGINTITLSSPFNWDGTSNIVIQICWSNNNGGGSSSTVKTDSYSTNKSMGIWADNQSVSTVCNATTTIPASGSSGTSTTRPRIIFNGTNSVATPTVSWTDGATVVATTSPATVTPTTNSTYTVTLTDVNGCSLTAISPSVSVIALPAAPTGTNSNQCGVGVPTAMVAGAASASDYFWYSAPTAGTLLQTGGTTYTTSISASTNLYVSYTNSVCTSQRTLVMANVTTPDAITTSVSNASICPNGSTTLTAVNTGTINTYNYTWTGSAGSGIATSVSGSTVAVSPTVLGVVTYTLTGVDNSCTAVATRTVMINNVPNLNLYSATPSVLCAGKTVTLTAKSVNATAGNATPGGAAGASDYTGGPYRSGAGTDNRVQWLFTVAELTAANIAPGNITALSFSVTSLGGGSMPNFTIRIDTTSLTTLGATFAGHPTNVVYGPSAYSAVSGINMHSFTTPFNWNGTSNVIVEVCHDAVSVGSSSTTRETITDRTVFSNTTGACGMATGTTVGLRPYITFYGQVGTDVSGAHTWMWNPGSLSGQTQVVTTSNATASPIAQTYTVAVTNPTTTCSNTATVVFTVNPLPAAPTATNSIQCGLGIPTAIVSGAGSAAHYRWYSAASGGSLTQSGNTTYTTSISSTTTFYVSQNNGTCESSRTAVTASVTPVDALTASVSTPTLCPNTSINLSVTKTGTQNTFNYTWTSSPSAGSGIPTSASGSSVTVTPSLAGAYIYTVTGVDGLCVATSTVASTVKGAPIAATITPSSGTICSGDSILLNAVTGNATLNFGTQATQNAGSTGSTGYPAPYTVFYGGQRMQMLVLASELTAAGFAAGSALTSIQFPVVSFGANWGTTTTDLKDFQINIGATSATSISAFQSGLSNVVPANNYTPTVGYNNMHNFTNSFTWDGTSNLIIETTFSNNMFGTVNELVTQYNSPTAFQSCIVFRTDNSTSLAMATNTTVSYSYNARPDFKLNAKVVLAWTPTTGLSSTSVASVKASPANTTTYNLSSSNGVCVTPSNSVMVTVNPLPNVSSSATQTVLCAGVTTTLNASGAATYTWMPGSATGSVTTVVPGSTTVYTVTGTDANTCHKTATVTINVNPLPAVAITATDSTLCDGDITTLTASGATTYSWTPNTITGLSGVVSPTITTAYSLSGTDANNCENSTVLTVTVNALPTVTATATSPTLCVGSTTTLNSGGAVNYTWTPGNATGSSTNVNPNADATYTVTGEDANGCINTAAVSLTVHPVPTVTVSAATATICAGNSVVLTAGGASTYVWNPGGAITSTVSVSPGTSTTYTVVGTNTLSCSASNTVMVTVSPCTGVEELVNGTDIRMYPNPNNGLLTLAFGDLNGPTQLSLYDTEGKMIFQHAVNALVTQLDLSSLASGVYYAEISSNQVLLQRTKLVIIR